ncbi:MAG: J domain-containing protein [Tepidamorphaceae bacterium]|nr:J domain-containing protein [Rhodobiaceae bacterium]MCC0049901.1 J domain-containing protein [Rhodobiaceae bacterium]
MTRNSKLFEGIRVKKTKGRAKPTVDHAPTCDHPECTKPGPHRAPKGRGREGQFFNFCLDHVRDYNKSYNYFSGMASDDVASYQRDAALGHRPTWKLGQNGAKAKKGRAPRAGRFAFDDPFEVFDGEAGAEPAGARRTVLAAHKHAFETLDLEETAERAEIRAKFKALVKRHHPDVNGGDRSGEHRLREIIQAYNTLKSAGFC